MLSSRGCSLFVWLAFVGCQSGGNNPSGTGPAAKTLPGYFKEISPADTMRFEVPAVAVEGDTIPNALFFSQLETRLMNGIDYFDSSGELIAVARYRFPLTDGTEAYLVDLRQHWFQNQSLFLFDKKSQAFTRRETVAEFYGGDGGQILIGSWLFDYDGDGEKDLVRREIEHWLLLDGDEPRDTLTESAVLLLWDGGRFRPATADTGDLVRRFPIQSFW